MASQCDGTVPGRGRAHVPEVLRVAGLQGNTPAGEQLPSHPLHTATTHTATTQLTAANHINSV